MLKSNTSEQYPCEAQRGFVHVTYDKPPSYKKPKIWIFIGEMLEDKDFCQR